MYLGPVPAEQQRPQAFMAPLGLYVSPGLLSGPQQQQQPLYQQAAPTSRWNPWLSASWDQQSLDNSFSTMAFHPPPTSVQDWVADSGVTHHTTPSVGNISTLRPLASSNPSSIVVGNGSSLPITLVGDSVLPRPFYLNNILLALDMVQSLLSVHRFTTDNWYSMEFDPFGLSVKDLTTKNVIIRSNSTDPLYTMCVPGSLTPSSSAVAALAAVPHTLTVVAPTTWHRRLGHPGPDALSSLSRSSFIQCTSNKHDFCHACQLGKHTRLPFCSSSHRAKHAFDLMHLDLWASHVVSVSGSKYYLVILDDFNHYLWTFPLKLKSDTFTTLSNFFAYVSNQFDRKIKVIQCDNGREFDNSSTRIFLLSNGTQFRMSCPYTSTQNGKIERIICSINNVIHTLLIQASLTGRYWTEGLHTATYLLDRLPTKAIQVACPHIALFRSVPSYEHLRVFGCTCYPNIAATAPHKLAPRSTRCVLLGYSSDHNGYRCLDLSTNRLIVSRHVVFDEDSFPLTASPNPTDLDFLCESGSTVFTVGTRLTTAGTVAPCQPALELPPGFEPLVAPLPAPAVRLGFLP
jgi:hypothetical protein